jgi:hypothetical protein
VRLDASDTTQLAARLSVGPRELATAVGAPWWIAEAAEGQGLHGTLFVGRTGPSVGIAVAPDELLVGRVEGVGDQESEVRWVLLDPVSVPLPRAEEGLLALGRQVDAAAAAQAPRLLWCRYCGGVYARIFTGGGDACLDCAAIPFP